MLLWELCPLGGTRSFSPGARQVQTLELARAQDRVFLESLQQRHQEDLDLLQSTHRYPQARAHAPLVCQGLAYSPVPLPRAGSAGVLPRSVPGTGRPRAVWVWSWWGQRGAPRVSQGGVRSHQHRPVGQKEEEPVPGPARPQPGLRLRRVA